MTVSYQLIARLFIMFIVSLDVLLSFESFMFTSLLRIFQLVNDLCQNFYNLIVNQLNANDFLKHFCKNAGILVLSRNFKQLFFSLSIKCFDF